MRTCEFPGCSGIHVALGYCNAHYRQLRKGKVLSVSTRTLPVEDRFWVHVHKTAGCWEWTGSTNGRGYGEFCVERNKRYAHRLSYEWVHGPIPEGMVVDHLCHNRACVRPDHLSLATHKQNTENRSGVQVNNGSGVHGVNWDRRRAKWRATVRHHDRQYHCGYFDDLSNAEAAAVSKRNELFTRNLLDRRKTP